jgi:hypothetical protein
MRVPRILLVILSILVSNPAAAQQAAPGTPADACWPLRGQVVEAEGGAAVAGAAVSVAGGPSVHSGPDGCFELCVAAEPPIVLTVRRAGQEAAQRVELASRPDAELTVRIDAAVAARFEDEVTVVGHADRPVEPAREVPVETVTAMPGAGEDVLQTIGALPGVASTDDWSSRLYVRGGRPDQNGIYLDGIPVFDPYRVFGLTSLFNPDTVGRVDFFPGGFDARYGDRLSAVVAVENRDGRLDRALAGTASLSLTNANLVAEGRLLSTVPSSFLVSARRSYFDLAMKSSEDGSGSYPSFVDGQARLSIEPSPGHRLAFTFVGYDEGTDLTEDEEADFGNVDDHVEVVDDQKGLIAGLNGSHRLGEALRLDYVLSATRNQQSSDIFYREGETGFETKYVQALTGDVLSLRTQGELALGSHTLLAGFEGAVSSNEVRFTLDTDDPRVEVPPSLRDFTEAEDFHRYGAFLQDTFFLTSSLALKAGLRWDRSTLAGTSSVSPRASVRWQPDEKWELRGAWGIYTQSPSYEALQGDGFFLDLRGIKDLGLKPERAEHFLLGASRTFDSGFRVALDLYDKELEEILQSGEYDEDVLVLADDGSLQSASRTRPNYLPENTRRGYARGAELAVTVLERASRPFYGMMSYTFGEARTRDEEAWRSEPWDRKHTVSLVGGWRFHPRWELGLRWRYASGFPTTPVTNVLRVVEDVDGDGAYDPSRGDVLTYQRDDPPGTEGSDNLPDYHRLDLRLEFSPRAGSVRWTFYLDVINAYARENVTGWSYNEDYTERTAETGMPFLPSIGVRAQF